MSKVVQLQSFGDKLYALLEDGRIFFTDATHAQWLGLNLIPTMKPDANQSTSSDEDLLRANMGINNQEVDEIANI